MPRPILAEPKYTYKKAERPQISGTKLPEDLLIRIAETDKTQNAVEIDFKGDLIGQRRVLQRIQGLHRRGRFGEAKLKSLRRGGKLFVWLDNRPRGRPPLPIYMEPEPELAEQPAEAPGTPGDGNDHD